MSHYKQRVAGANDILNCDLCDAKEVTNFKYNIVAIYKIQLSSKKSQK